MSLFEHEITFLDGLDITVLFNYYPATPDTRWEPGTPDEIEIDALVYNGQRFEEPEIDDHLLEACELWLINHFDDWYDDPYA